MDRSVFVFATCLAWLAPMSASVAHAQPANAAGTNAHAIELYAEGRNLLSAKRPADALPKLVESLSLLPSPNTELLIAHAHRELGHRATAFRTYVHVAETAAQEIAKGADKYKTSLDEARRWQDELRPQIGVVVIDGPTALEVEIVTSTDPAPVHAKSGEEVWVDPGDVVVRTLAPAPEEQHVTVSAAQVAHVSVSAPAIDVATTGPVQPPPPTPTPEDASSTVVSVPGIVVGAVGVAALIVAAGTGGAALSLKSDLEACNVGDPCAATFEDDKSRGATLQLVTNAMIGVGAGLVAAGATIWIIDAATSGGSDETRSAWIVAPVFDDAGRPAGAGFFGRF